MREICHFLSFLPTNYQANLIFSALWYASESDSDVGLGETHRFFGYNTNIFGYLLRAERAAKILTVTGWVLGLGPMAPPENQAFKIYMYRKDYRD